MHKHKETFVSGKVLVMGSFVADLAFRSARLPAWGETLMGDSFALGPGGKGSNQAVAAARAGAAVQFVSKLGADAFGQLARDTWAAEGIDATLVGTCDTATGAAAILIDAVRGENAIIVVPGACFTLTPEDVDEAAVAIRAATVLLAQLEVPLETVERGLQIARDAGVLTILNPAPAPSTPLPDSLLALCDFFVPNETEAELLTGLTVDSMETAEQAADILLVRGARNVILTLGSRGSLMRAGGVSTNIPPFHAGHVLETTGAGDAFCGGFAAALAEGRSAEDAARFASATAGISVTRAGTAPSMPRRAEVDALLRERDEHGRGHVSVLR
jgi:ribokinase